MWSGNYSLNLIPIEENLIWHPMWWTL